MPAYLTAAAVAPAVATPVAIWMPALPLPDRLAARVCSAMLVLGGLLLVSTVVLPAFDVWYPAMATALSAITVWLAMFWVARRPSDAPDAEASEQRSDEDNDGGGGGPRRPKPPPRGPSPDGMPLDWDAFDREREAWEPAPSSPREREREPALA